MERERVGSWAGEDGLIILFILLCVRFDSNNTWAGGNWSKCSAALPHTWKQNIESEDVEKVSLTKDISPPLDSVPHKPAASRPLQLGEASSEAVADFQSHLASRLQGAAWQGQVLDSRIFLESSLHQTRE